MHTNTYIELYQRVWLQSRQKKNRSTHWPIFLWIPYEGGGWVWGLSYRRLQEHPVLWAVFSARTTTVSRNEGTVLYQAQCLRFRLVFDIGWPERLAISTGREGTDIDVLYHKCTGSKLCHDVLQRRKKQPSRMQSPSHGFRLSWATSIKLCGWYMGVHWIQIVSWRIAAWTKLVGFHLGLQGYFSTYPWYNC